MSERNLDSGKKASSSEMLFVQSLETYIPGQIRDSGFQSDNELNPWNVLQRVVNRRLGLPDADVGAGASCNLPERYISGSIRDSYDFAINIVVKMIKEAEGMVIDRVFDREIEAARNGARCARYEDAIYWTQKIYTERHLSLHSVPNEQPFY